MYFCVVLYIVCFVTFLILFVCICVLNNCHQVTTQLQLNISYHIISYHIISYHIISYHIISYHIVSYRIVSYRIVSYHIISYHIISHHITSHHIISYHIISYHIISYHMSISCPLFIFVSWLLLPPSLSLHTSSFSCHILKPIALTSHRSPLLFPFSSLLSSHIQHTRPDPCPSQYYPTFSHVIVLTL